MSYITREQLVEAAKVVEELQSQVSSKKYEHPGESSFHEVIQRVCRTFKANSARYGNAVGTYGVEEMLTEGRFIPAGSILSGLNSPTKCSLSNCYVTPIERDSIEDIFDNLKKCARTYSYRGGTGVDITVLRPSGDPVNNAARSSSGAVSFMPVLSEVTNAIGQAGRRGALLVSIDIRHPDAMKFIWSKSDPERVFGKDFLTGKVPDIYGANISLKLTDDFMKAAVAGEDWTFYFPDRSSNPQMYDEIWDGNYQKWENNGGEFIDYETMPAADILRDIAKAANATGDPGVLYIDTVEKNTPGTFIHPDLKPISTNPCFSGEMRLLTKAGYVKFKDLDGKAVEVVTPAGKVSDGAVWSNGVKEVVKVTYKHLKKRYDIVCTPDHVFMLWGGTECQAKDLLGEQIIHRESATSASPARVVSVEPAGETEVFDFSEPMFHWGVVEHAVVHNCGEQPLGPYNNCLLGALVLSKYVQNPFTQSARFDDELFVEDCMKAVVFMNVMSDINENLHPLKEQRDIDAFGKRIGIEFTALGDTLAMLGIRYGSSKSFNFVGSIMRTKAHIEIATSCSLAREVGPCPALESEEAREAFIACPYVQNLKLSDDIIAGIRKFGLRNSAFNTVGPTGTISIMSNNCTSGIEPLFMFAYARQTRLDPGKTFNMLHKPAVDYLLDTWESEGWGTKTLEEIKRRLNYVEAWEVSWESRIKMQGVVQKYTDTSISSTINLPNDATDETVFDIYVEAWSRGLKGITVFRDGCKTGVLSAVKEETSEPEGSQGPNTGSSVVIKELLDEESSVRHRVSWKGAKIYVIVTLDEDDRPLEVFAKLPREAGINGDGFYSEEIFQEKFSLWETVTRLISLLLRSGMPLEKILSQLEKSTYSIVDAPSILIRILRKYLPNSFDDVEDEVIIEQGLGAKCSECGKNAYVYENGCGVCKACGYTTCG